MDQGLSPALLARIQGLGNAAALEALKVGKLQGCAAKVSVAPAASGLDCGLANYPRGAFDDGDSPAREVPLLVLHGKQDIVVEFECAERQLAAAFDHWDIDPESATTVSADDSYTWRRWNTPAGTPLEFIEHDQAAESWLLLGHCFPGSDDLDPTENGQLMPFGCADDTSLHWGEAVVQFFLANPRGTTQTFG
jgi:hypothetical protein